MNNKYALQGIPVTTIKSVCLLLVTSLVVFLLSACSASAPTAIPTEVPPDDVAPTEDTVPSPEEPAASFYNEAPELAELVAAGELPPVDERLPTNPMIVEPVEQVGVYGGTWRRGMKENLDHANLVRTIGYENLMRWDEQWTRVIPNVAQSVDVNDDASEYTFHLREGMRWSDGEPYTVDDIMFWYEDVFSHEAFPNADLPWLFGDRDGLVVEKVDDYTVIFRFAQPNGLFLQTLSTPRAADPTGFPRHYLEQFHVDYNPDIDALVKEAGVADWVELFQLKFGDVTERSVDVPTRWANAELPSLRAWVLTDGYAPDLGQLVVKRNPYYWKVDIDGNQLPYIDRVVYSLAAETDELVAQAVKGEIDMQIRHIAIDDNRAIFEENMEAGNYHLFRTIPSDANNVAISLNWTHLDPVLREIFQNKDFRIGLSHAINRQEIIDKVYAGNGQPYQVAPAPSSPHYHEQLATQYVAYDVDLANEYLDKAGYSERDENGFRLGPDGEPISFTITVSDAPLPAWALVMEEVQQYWQKVGLDVQFQVKERLSFEEYTEANEHDVAVWNSPGGLDVVLGTRNYVPGDFAAYFGVPWSIWKQDPTNSLAEEPPPDIQEPIDLYNQLKSTGDQNEQDALMAEILDIAAEQFYVIGIVLPGEGYGIVKNNFHNVPTVMPGAWTYPSPAPTNPEQYFIDPQE